MEFFERVAFKRPWRDLARALTSAKPDFQSAKKRIRVSRSRRARPRFLRGPRNPAPAWRCGQGRGAMFLSALSP